MTFPTQPAAEQPPYVATRGGRSWLWAGILAGMLAAAALFCCGGGLLVIRFGMDVMTNEVQDELARRPEIEENIGEIRSLKVDLMRSGAEDDEDVFVYNIEGSRGSGRVKLKQATREDGTEVIVSGELTMQDGRRIPLPSDR